MDNNDQVSDEAHNKMVKEFLNNRNAMQVIAWGDSKIIKSPKQKNLGRVINYTCKPTLNDIRISCDNSLFYSVLRRKDSSSGKKNEYYKHVIYECIVLIIGIASFVFCAWGLYSLMNG